jgi:hypothetical protein
MIVFIPWLECLLFLGQGQELASKFGPSAHRCGSIRVGNPFINLVRSHFFDNTSARVNIHRFSCLKPLLEFRWLAYIPQGILTSCTALMALRPVRRWELQHNLVLSFCRLIGVLLLQAIMQAANLVHPIQKTTSSLAALIQVVSHEFLPTSPVINA